MLLPQPRYRSAALQFRCCHSSSAALVVGRGGGRVTVAGDNALAPADPPSPGGHTGSRRETRPPPRRFNSSARGRVSLREAVPVLWWRQTFRHRRMGKGSATHRPSHRRACLAGDRRRSQEIAGDRRTSKRGRITGGAHSGRGVRWALRSTTRAGGEMRPHPQPHEPAERRARRRPRITKAAGHLRRRRPSTSEEA